MSARALVEILLRDSQSLARGLVEASVHPAHRGKIWRASYRDETGRQRWRSTGTADRSAALALAKEWEEEARRKRGAGPRPRQKALIRVMAQTPAEREVIRKMMGLIGSTTDAKAR